MWAVGRPARDQPDSESRGGRSDRIVFRVRVRRTNCRLKKKRPLAHRTVVRVSDSEAQESVTRSLLASESRGRVQVAKLGQLS